MKMETFTSAQIIFAGFQALTFIRPQHIPRAKKISSQVMLPVILICLSLTVLKAEGIPGNKTSTGSDKWTGTDNIKANNARKLPLSVINHSTDGNLGGSLALVRNLSEAKSSEAANISPAAPAAPSAAPVEAEFDFSEAVFSSGEAGALKPSVEASSSRGSVMFNIEISSETDAAAMLSVVQKTSTFYQEDIMLKKGHNRKAIDLSNVPKGTYWLKINTETQTEMVKIIIQ